MLQLKMTYQKFLKSNQKDSPLYSPFDLMIEKTQDIEALYFNNSLPTHYDTQSSIAQRTQYQPSLSCFKCHIINKISDRLIFPQLIRSYTLNLPIEIISIARFFLTDKIVPDFWFRKLKPPKLYSMH